MFSIQEDTLKTLRDKIGNLETSVPNGTYELMLETFATVTADNLNSIASSTNIYPSMGSTEYEVFEHLADKDLVNLFHTPGKVDMNIFINRLDVIKFGIDVNGNKEVIIPKGTTIVIDNLTFTTDYAINVRVVNLDTNDDIYHSGIPILEAISNNVYDGVGNINSTIVTDVDGVEWIMCSLPIKQYEVITKIVSLNLASKLDVTIPIEDGFYGANIFLTTIDDNNDDVVIPVEKTFTDVLFNRGLSAKLTLVENGVRVEIPSHFMRMGYTGRLTIEVFTTKGKINVPLYDFDRGDFVIKLGTTVGEKEAACANVTLSAGSQSVLAGGNDPKPLSIIKEDLINRSNGNREYPITEHDIVESGRRYNILIFKLLDTITERLYAGTIPIPVNIFNMDSVPSVKLGKSRIVYAEVDTNSIELVNGYLIIKGGTMFKRTDVLTPVSQPELDALTTMTFPAIVDWYNRNNIGYTPYTYVLGPDHNLTSSKVYRLTKNDILSLRIIVKNQFYVHRVNIVESKLTKKADGYEYYVLLAGHEEGGVVLNNNLQVAIAISGSDYLMQLEKVGDPMDGFYRLALSTNEFIDDKGYLQIYHNGTPLKVNLEQKFDVYIYNTTLVASGGTFQPTYELANNYSNSISALVLTKQETTLRFGVELKRIWNTVLSGYTIDKYKRYTEDIMAYYEKDVLRKLDGSVYRVSGYDVIPNILYPAGDPVMIDGVHQVLHAKGDIIYTNGEAEIDIIGGISRTVDIMVIDASYKLNETTVYQDGLKVLEELIYSWLTTNFEELNKYLLERTEVKFLPGSSLNDISININNKPMLKKSEISPTIILNIKSNTINEKYSNASLVKIIGNIITEELSNRKIDKRVIRDKIIEVLGNEISGVVMKDFIDDSIDTFESDEVFNIRKLLTTDNIVVYDLTVETIKVI